MDCSSCSSILRSVVYSCLVLTLTLTLSWSERFTSLRPQKQLLLTEEQYPSTLKCPWPYVFSTWVFYTVIHDHCRSLLMALSAPIQPHIFQRISLAARTRPAYSTSGRSEGRSIRRYWWSRGSLPVVGDTVEEHSLQGCFLILCF